MKLSTHDCAQVKMLNNECTLCVVETKRFLPILSPILSPSSERLYFTCYRHGWDLRISRNFPLLSLCCDSTYTLNMAYGERCGIYKIENIVVIAERLRVSFGTSRLLLLQILT